MGRSGFAVWMGVALTLVGCAGAGDVAERTVRGPSGGTRSNAVEAPDPRHEAVIVWTREHRASWFSQDAAEWAGELSGRLGRGSRRFHPRTEGNVRVKYSEAFEDAATRLSRWDVLTLLVLDEVVREPATVEELLRQSVLDRADRATEYGGVLSESGATPHMPDEGERGLDRAFVAPRAMFEGSEGVLAHYHFHAQALDNAEYAGPSAGDLEYAARHGQHCVVFTSVGPGRLDVDVYFPSGVVVDLGEIAER